MKKAKEEWIYDIGHRVIRGRSALWSVGPSLWPQKFKRSLEVAATYFMTPKVTVTFVIGLT